MSSTLTRLQAREEAQISAQPGAEGVKALQSHHAIANLHAVVKLFLTIKPKIDINLEKYKILGRLIILGPFIRAAGDDTHEFLINYR